MNIRVYFYNYWKRIMTLKKTGSTTFLMKWFSFLLIVITKMTIFLQVIYWYAVHQNPVNHWIKSKKLTLLSPRTDSVLLIDTAFYPRILDLSQYRRQNFEHYYYYYYYYPLICVLFVRLFTEQLALTFRSWIERNGNTCIFILNKWLVQEVFFNN